MLLGLEINCIAGRKWGLWLTGQGDDNHLVLSIDVEGLPGKTKGHHGPVWINPPAIAVACCSVGIGFGGKIEEGAPRLFDPVGGKDRRVIDNAVSQKKNAKATEISQSNSGAAAANFLSAIGFQSIEGVKFHT